MPEILRVLIVEDEESDAELIARELRRAGFQPVWNRVETEEAFLEHLGRSYDIILSDHRLPQFSAAQALSHVRALGSDVPFVVVSAAIGEEQAVALLRAGAADYLMKDRLGRLGEAIRHALEQKRLRERAQTAQDALRRLNEELERRIAERTSELEQANRSLARELAERRRIEQVLRQSEADLERRVAQRTSDLKQSQERLRSLASELTLTEERERRRLAGELHDYLAQLLVLGRIKLQQIHQQLSDQRAGAALNEVDQIFHDSLAYTRSVMAELAPPMLQEFGLASALCWLAERMKTHGLTVEVITPAVIPKPVEDHAVLLFQSVRELLFNVVKHAGTAQATVTVGCTPKGELEVTVEDRGCGFDPASVAMGHVGGQLKQFGLFSVRERMEAMGGCMMIESAPGCGSKIVLRVPCDPPERTPEDGAATRAAAQDDAGESEVPAIPLGQRPARVLLVDDHAMVREGLRRVLEHYDDLTVVGEAADGWEALEATRSVRPDVVVMDVNMPRLDGIAATTRIKQEMPDMAVIGLSVVDTEPMQEAMRAAGAAAFVSKECAASELYQAIQTALFPPACNGGAGSGVTDPDR
ncbi:MAG TPA: response regulator [Nitrospiraceae bacterium]|nr:response regulator [Nitrospiraceae bacterium]